MGTIVAGGAAALAVQSLPLWTGPLAGGVALALVAAVAPRRHRRRLQTVTVLAVGLAVVLFFAAGTPLST